MNAYVNWPFWLSVYKFVTPHGLSHIWTGCSLVCVKVAYLQGTTDTTYSGVFDMFCIIIEMFCEYSMM